MKDEEEAAQMTQLPKYSFSIFALMLTLAIATPTRGASFVTSGQVFELTPFSSSIDWVKINVVAANTVINLDILAWEQETAGISPTYVDLNSDGEFTFGDTFLMVVDSSDTNLTNWPVGDDDASPGAPAPVGGDGSISGLDSNFNFNFPLAGDYKIYIGEASSPYNLAEALAGVKGEGLESTSVLDTDHFDWQLTLTSAEGDNFSVLAVHTIPTPSALWAGVVAFTAVSFVRRRKK